MRKFSLFAQERYPVTLSVRPSQETEPDVTVRMTESQSPLSEGFPLLEE